ncbi:MAG: peptide chain release factor-like protein [Dehalococcoidia bacterium]
MHPYLGLSDEELGRQCVVETMRASGPGGQHRNKTESGVRMRHGPTGVVAQAFERRSQHENRAVALRRLRQNIALEWRQPMDAGGFAISPEVAAILPGTKQGRVGPNNERFWPGIAGVLDLFVALECSVSGTAEALGMSTGALSRLLLESAAVGAKVNESRAARGMRALR